MTAGPEAVFRRGFDGPLFTYLASIFSMRDLINKYAYHIVGAALILVILLVGFQQCRGRKPPPEMIKYLQAFYIDELTGEESVRSTNEYPPLIGKSGKRTLVRAYKFTNDGGKTSFISYLEKYSDEEIEILTTSTNDAHKMNILNKGPLIRRPGAGQEWVPYNSITGEQLLEAAFVAMQRPDGGKVEPVYPK